MAAHQAPPSLGFSRQEHWTGLQFPSPMHESEKWKESRSVMSNTSWPHGLQPTRLLHPWDFPGKSTRVGCHRLTSDFHFHSWFLKRQKLLFLEVTFLNEASCYFLEVQMHVCVCVCMRLLRWLSGKKSACHAGDASLIPGWRRCPRVGNNNLLQLFFLENSIDRGAWVATIYGVTKSQTRLAHMHVYIYTYIYWYMYVYLHFISTFSLLFLKIKSSPPF